jgi:hypothetical protein
MHMHPNSGRSRKAYEFHKDTVSLGDMMEQNDPLLISRDGTIPSIV